MKTSFSKTKKLLEDSFVEKQLLGKESLKKRTQPMDFFTNPPINLQLIDWTKKDNQEVIYYSFYETEIGRVLIANTSKGVCFLGFSCENDSNLKADFMSRFPQHQFEEKPTDLQKLAADYCNGNNEVFIALHLKGTDFQLNIWSKLVLIPQGRLSTYGSILNNNKSARAIGSAVGANPVSYIIPCHRIIRGDGSFEGYYWGNELKKQLLAYELQD